MADLNCFTFTGHLTRDAAIKEITGGKKLLVTDVAINYGFGENKKTLFVKAQQWGNSVDKIVSYLKKGSLISCSGELSRNEWESKEGKTYVDFIVNCNNIILLQSKMDNESKIDSEQAIEQPELAF